ncbi:hypothetical protein G8A07_16490 [Roseateles sp. DAIF2]|uniref:hypothetical protein n=1 Tax=Roseateles sp. DAIF2 TaxID=2714952 RepID=UPI0018A2C418|nr:hypothetical protein [Roseateles sp. DAIF2]QPF74363.1 hypothetical protein G8A07_16490 [Roseateles sp. DAIF2]
MGPQSARSWRIGIWLLFAFLALLWSGSIGLLGALLDWLAHALASGEAQRLGGAAAEWKMPAWLAFWVDESLLRTLQQGLQWALDMGRDGLPWLGKALGWLTPLLWILWLIGLLAMLLLTFLGLRLLRSMPAAGR